MSDIYGESLEGTTVLILAEICEVIHYSITNDTS